MPKKIKVKAKPKSEFVLAPVSIASLATAISQRTKSKQLIENTQNLLNEIKGMRREMREGFKNLGKRLDKIARELHQDHLKMMGK